MKKTIFLFLLIFSISFVLATNCPPGVPPSNLDKIYNGIVSYQGNIISGSYEIRAVIGTYTVGIGSVNSGNYDITVFPCSGVTGTVYFYINGIKTNEKGVYSGIDDWGKTENLNLTLNQIPGGLTCGDGIIQLGEECDGTNLAGRSINNCGTNWQGTISCSSNCRIDYSNCIYSPPNPAPPNNPPSGGGGSGGSGSLGGILPSSDGVIHLNSNTETSNNKEKETQGTGKQVPFTGSAILDFVKSGKGLTIFGILLVLGLVAGIVVLKKKRR